MKLTRPIIFFLSVLFVAGFSQARATAQTTEQASSNVTESGKIRFYETHHIRGEENYQIKQSPNGELILDAKTELPFAGQDTNPLVNATLRTTRDFTPQSFTIKGPTLLEIQENTSISIQDVGMQHKQGLCFGEPVP